MRDIRRRRCRWRAQLTDQASAQIMPGDAQHTGMRRYPLALFQHVLDRMRRGNELRTEQEEGQQEVGKVFLH